jgi:hypothetical protein
MANMAEGYPFIFQMNDRTNADELLEYTLQYRFFTKDLFCQR